MADHEVLHGGPSVPWKQSIRGKLHTLMTERAARNHAAAVGRERFSRGEKLAALAFGLVQTGLMLATFLAASGHG